MVYDLDVFAAKEAVPQKRWEKCLQSIPRVSYNDFIPYKLKFLLRKLK